MQRIPIPLFLLFLFALIAASFAGCEQLGMAKPVTFDDKLAYAYATNTSIREASSEALRAGQITGADMREVLQINDQARALLDSAKLAFAAGDTVGANNKLVLVTTILTEIQTFLRTRGLKAALDARRLTWA